MSIRSPWYSLPWNRHAPYSWKMRLMDWCLRLFGWASGEVFQLSRGYVDRYPVTLTEELDVLESLNYFLRSAQDFPGDQIVFQMGTQSVRPGIGSLLRSGLPDVYFPKNVLCPHAGIDRVADDVPKREDVPGQRYDYRHCSVTMRAWNVIKAEMPEGGAVEIHLHDPRFDGPDRSRIRLYSIALGRYRIHRGRVELHPNLLSVFIKSK